MFRRHWLDATTLCRSGFLQCLLSTMSSSRPPGSSSEFRPFQGIGRRLGSPQQATSAAAAASSWSARALPSASSALPSAHEVHSPDHYMDVDEIDPQAVLDSPLAELELSDPGSDPDVPPGQPEPVVLDPAALAVPGPVPVADVDEPKPVPTILLAQAENMKVLLSGWLLQVPQNKYTIRLCSDIDQAILELSLFISAQEYGLDADGHHFPDEWMDSMFKQYENMKTLVHSILGTSAEPSQDTCDGDEEELPKRKRVRTKQAEQPEG